MTKFVNKMDVILQSHNLAIYNQVASIKNLETHIRYIANSLSEEVQKTLLSNIMTNPKESVQAIYLMDKVQLMKDQVDESDTLLMKE